MFSFFKVSKVEVLYSSIVSKHIQYSVPKDLSYPMKYVSDLGEEKNNFSSYKQEKKERKKKEKQNLFWWDNIHVIGLGKALKDLKTIPGVHERNRKDSVDFSAATIFPPTKKSLDWSNSSAALTALFSKAHMFTAWYLIICCRLLCCFQIFIVIFNF